MEKIPSLRHHVTRCANKNTRELEKSAHNWMVASAKNRLDYELEWLGVPIIQTAEDIVLMQELLYRIQPDFVIETGVAHGGSLIFYASMLELFGLGEVIGIDIDIRRHNRDVIEQHPLFKRITLIEGSSVSQDTLDTVQSLVPENATTVVCFDSNHYKEHVALELKHYARFVSAGSYMVVFDTVTSLLVDDGGSDKSYRDNGPLEAVNEFLAERNDFVLDEEFNKLFISTSYNGFLKRIR